MLKAYGDAFMDTYDAPNVSGDLLQTGRATNILQTRGDRVSFSHEMFLKTYRSALRVSSITMDQQHLPLHFSPGTVRGRLEGAVTMVGDVQFCT